MIDLQAILREMKREEPLPPRLKKAWIEAGHHGEPPWLIVLNPMDVEGWEAMWKRHGFNLQPRYARDNKILATNGYKLLMDGASLAIPVIRSSDIPRGEYVLVKF